MAQSNTMDIQRESPDKHTIQSYSDISITVNHIVYQTSLILSAETIDNHWPVHSLKDLTTETITALLDYEPEVIIIGHSEAKAMLSPNIISFLAQKRIGIECMSLGAACRTFNVLLSEKRHVVFGFIQTKFTTS